MQLVQFIQDIIQDGKVMIDGQIIPFTETEIQETIQSLHQYYEHQLPELTGTIPAFDKDAAIWGAGFLYRAVQLAMLRELGEDAVTGLLTPFKGAITPDAILSVDLSFRYLPGLLGLAKSLAPDDVLVKRLQETAMQWPLSSVGTRVEGAMNIEVIMSNTCLRSLYIDRIIEARDSTRCDNELIIENIKEALGDYSQVLWPGWEPVIKEK